MGEKRQKKRRMSMLTRQISGPLAGFIILLILLNAVFLFYHNMSKYLNTRFDSAENLGQIVATDLEDFRSLDFLIPYWEEHAEEMEFFYDDENRLREKEMVLLRKLPSMTELQFVSSNEVRCLDEEGQRVFAEVAYSRLCSYLDDYKRVYRPLYLYCFMVRGDEIRYHVTGTLEDEKRVGQGGELYELGMTSPYQKGWYPILDAILETGEPSAELELSLQKGADRSVVHCFVPVYFDGELVQVVGVSFQWKDLLFDSLMISLSIMAISAVLFVLVGLGNIFIIRKVVTLPLLREQEIIRTYEEDKDAEGASKALGTIGSRNEIQSLAESFSSMVTEIDRYMDEVKSVTAEKERIGAELGMAASIQESQLPNVFPAFPDRKEFDIYASMDPAKEVGGDFYDFFLVDEDHLGLVMADVSGKGIPASLFMMISKVLIKNQLMGGKSPGEALENVNNQLMENNEAELFVTVWLAVLELSTGKGVVANAGHEHPVVRRAGGQYEMIVYPHDLAVAVMEDVSFKEHEFELHPGDSLFVYTDGVPEATSGAKELYGTDRMLEALNKDPEAEPKNVLIAVREGIDTFVAGAEQFDDITMLSLKYFGP